MLVVLLVWQYQQNLGRPGAPLQRALPSMRMATRFFATPCDMGREGIVSKRADSRYKPTSA